jgi:23S rRNA (cytidine1920-2'-O)/16S rRNA (cytidine1409-2'-O)-methyltransferase
MKKERADKVLANRGLADSYQKAQALIMAGLVFSGKQRIEKPGQMIASDRELTLKEKNPYVSRGGLKLAEALEVFEIPIQNKVAADLGASTGGFTDCLLQKGAKRVYAVDVDISQLDWHLKEDSRVVCIEKNARYLTKDDFVHICAQSPSGSKGIPGQWAASFPHQTSVRGEKRTGGEEGNCQGCSRS